MLKLLLAMYETYLHNIYSEWVYLHNLFTYLWYSLAPPAFHKNSKGLVK